MDARAAICRRLGEGESLKAICADPAMPSAATVHRWKRRDASFAARLRSARSAVGGRAAPVALTEPVFREICDRLSKGEFLTAICRDAHMPCRQHVHDRLRAESDLAVRYREARAMQAEHLFEEILSIADEDENPVRARLRIEVRKWLVARLAPDRFGERQGEEPDAARRLVEELVKGRERVACRD
jgi:hypothetical protein